MCDPIPNSANKNSNCPTDVLKYVRKQSPPLTLTESPFLSSETSWIKLDFFSSNAEAIFSRLLYNDALKIA